MRCRADLRNESGVNWFAAMRLVLSEAIQYEGSTLSDGTYIGTR